MTWFKRQKTFAEETEILADDFEEEFDEIAGAFNGLFSAGTVAANSGLVLTTSYQDVPGAVLSITPSVPSLLLVNMSFGKEYEDKFAYATLKLDSAAEEAPAIVLLTNEFSGSQPFLLKLSAGAHTVKIRAKRAEVTGKVEIQEGRTRFTYLLIPNPEP